MSNSRAVVLLSVLVGVLLLVVAGVYFADPAHSLPSFFPGHVGASSPEHAHHHVKHGIAALVVALGIFAYAWFATGPRTPAPPNRDAHA
jgi:NADH:ubiquinone oxidoreductase subunit 5 (subunit L)/multisubunit Na+/H+ antiporter MnhA subunit